MLRNIPPFSGGFFCFLAMKKNRTKEKLLSAFSQSKTGVIADICKLAGVTVGTYYFHFYKDPKFRLEVFKKQRERLTAEIDAIAL